jgi:hypothetical protein
MPELRSVISEGLKQGKKPFENTSVFLIHHLTAEILGTVSALRKLGCTDLVIIFVGYNSEAASTYAPDLNELPSDEVQYYVLEKSEGESHFKVNNELIKTRSSDGDFPFEKFEELFKAQKSNFLDAMQRLSLFNIRRLIKRTHQESRQCLLIEDGGYIAPTINNESFSASSPLKLSDSFSFPVLPKDKNVDDYFTEHWEKTLDAVSFCSVEHTRNGYDRLFKVEQHHKSLKYPAFSIAVSYLKSQLESETVADTIINAIVSVLYSQGFVLSKRNMVVIGSRGNIGRNLMKRFQNRLNDPKNELAGSDLKLNSSYPHPKVPEWHPESAAPPIAECIESIHYKELPEHIRHRVDLIVGVTGGPTKAHPTFDMDDLKDWLLNSKKTNLFIVSGSTKTAEFPEILDWFDNTCPIDKAEIEFQGYKVHLVKNDLINRLSDRNYGSKYTFTTEYTDENDELICYQRQVYLLHNLLPINFLYFGVPTEIIDNVLAQLISSSIAIINKHSSLTKKCLYAVDYDSEATEGVYEARKLKEGTHIPLPLPN